MSFSFSEALHSIMFLLILGDAYDIDFNSNFTFHYVSINTKKTEEDPLLKTSFTFHYVSINTQRLFNSFFRVLALHSIMFLLIQPI